MTDALLTPRPARFSIFLHALRLSALPGATLDIVDRWKSTAVPFIVLSEAGTSARCRFQVVRAFSTSGRRFLELLDLGPWPNEEAQVMPVLVAMADADHITTLTPDDVQALSKDLTDSGVVNDLDDLDAYLGHLPDRTRHLGQLRPLLADALTPCLWAGTDEVTPRSTLVVVRAWHVHGVVFLALRVDDRQTERLGTSFAGGRPTGAINGLVARLDWTLDVGPDRFAILAYPPDITADSDVRPRIVLQVTGNAELRIMSIEEFSRVRIELIDRLSTRPEVRVEDVHKGVTWVDPQPLLWRRET